MTNFIPIFPLSLVIYPDENVNLHVFEPRYKQLIHECLEKKRPFGVPCIIKGEVKEYGTLVEVIAVEKEYENGEMDIKTRGVKVFRVLEIIPEVPDKLYSGAIVHYPKEHKQGNPQLMAGIVKGMRHLHRIMEVIRDFNKQDEALVSFDIAHVSGLSFEEEYEVLCLFHERQRQEFLRLHLEKILPVVAGLDRLKKRIQLNGHFQMPGSEKT